MPSTSNYPSLFAVLAVCCLSGCPETGVPIDAPPTDGPGPSTPTTPTGGDYTLGATRALTPQFFGYNGNLTTSSMPWSDSALLSGINELHAGNLRYPGGTIASYWDWRTSKVSTSAPANIVANFRYPMPIDEYATAIARTGATPVLVVNMLTATLEDQLAFLRDAQSRGVPIERIELGNEFFFRGGSEEDYIDRFPTAEDYAREVTRWVTAISAEFPGARFSAVGDATLPGEGVGARRATWNAKVTATTSSPHAYTIHHYIKIDASTPVASIPALALHDLDGLQDEFDMFSARGKRVWITEYNIIDDSRTNAHAGTWSHALSMATLAQGFLSAPAVELIDLHNLSGDVIYAALFRTNNAFGASGPATTRFARTGAGHLLGKLAELSEDMTQARGVRISDNVRGIYLENATQHALALINVSGEAQRIDITGLVADGAGLQAWSAPVERRIVTAADINTTALVSTRGKLTLPPYSLTFTVD